MKNLLTRLYDLHGKVFSYFAYLKSPFLLFLRLYFGWQLAQSGWGKLHHLDNVTEFFTSLHLPAPAFTAVCISCLEFFGGILLAIGLFSRILSLILTVNLIVAYITADNEAWHSIFSDPDKFIAAAPFTFLWTSLIVLIFGPGLLSLDELLSRAFGWKSSKADTPTSL
jgi:putative oxidoreductase